MTRSTPSRADRDLINQAAERGSTISAAQLERWRRVELLPRPVVRRLGYAGSETVYPPGTVEIVRALARHSRRGRGTHDLALLLFFDRAPVPDHVLTTAVHEACLVFHRSLVARIAPHRHSGGDDWLLDAEFEEAEAMARSIVATERSFIRDMRHNLRSVRPRASMRQLDDVLVGVLTAIAHPPVDPDEELVRDIVGAMGLSGPPGPMHLGASVGLAFGAGLNVASSGPLPSRVHVPPDRLDVSAAELIAARDDLHDIGDVLGATAGEEFETITDPMFVRGRALMCVLWCQIR
ncbi:hypothetical protein ACIRL2_41240 [Embleya sp. NPDC127516]|uniref:hypothetical protein n=1 Tax=Embleya sp. NPDC127516 TaxID=3363990 RepID=UPI003811CB8F